VHALWKTTTSISLVKSASVTSFSASGTAITYYYEVTNTGTTTLTGVGVTDPMPGLSAVVCPDPTLAAGASEQCSATYSTTSTDVTNGSLHNTGTATGTPPTGPCVTATSSLTIPYVAPGSVGTSTPSSSAIGVVKSASVTSFSASGTAITYYYEVTNTGTTTLTGVGVTDPTLAAGASEQCSATYSTTSTDVTNGSLHNTGTATGTPPTGPVVTATSTLTIPYVPPGSVTSTSPSPSPGISLTKTPSTSSYDAVGQVVTYTYVITNNGNVSLASTQYTVTDNTINGGAAFDCGAPQVLAMGASITCTNTYTITQADLSSGSVTNLATATNGSQVSPVATATIAVTASTSTSVVTKASKPSKTKIPSSAPQTGGGGEAKSTGRSGLVAMGILLLLGGFASVSFALRRRKA
jgi:uncharacterized repeat protein (TIGR01451 family)